ncbi:hypothetical protein BCON_0159g00240 [Botryotinia convoluta]|uniref:Uncharacterized protein n=1 Tax=Botryotinia convoluta TaxID=54673 RepID=A0A4Z1HR67_9HELO|nr:hypothetical protein BCON_0159g00240 [Botryotinia convoluta]
MFTKNKRGKFSLKGIGIKKPEGVAGSSVFAILVDLLWHSMEITPKAKTDRLIQSAMRLPVQSATGAANRAPKSVPADKIDTIKDDSLEVIPS